MKSIFASLLLCGALASLAACGGGGNDGSSPPTPSVSDGAPDDSPDPADFVGASDQVVVASDVFTIPLDGGIPDRVLPGLTYTNSRTTEVDLLVSLTSHRSIQTSATQGGPAVLMSWVSVLNVTAGQLPHTPMDSTVHRLEGLAAGTTTELVEDAAAVVTVPPDTTYSFTPYARFLVPGPAGNPVLTTSDLTLTYTARD